MNTINIMCEAPLLKGNIQTASLVYQSHPLPLPNHGCKIGTEKYISTLDHLIRLTNWWLARNISFQIYRVDIVFKNICFSQWQKCGCFDHTVCSIHVHSCQIPEFHMLYWSTSSLPPVFKGQVFRLTGSNSTASKEATTSGLWDYCCNSLSE